MVTLVFLYFYFNAKREILNLTPAQGVPFDVDCG